MNNKTFFYITIFFVLIAIQDATGKNTTPDTSNTNTTIIIGTFLGSAQRNYYGNEAPDALNVHWKHYLGEGKTVISRKLGERTWAGAGWTGQPLLVSENDTLFLIQGAYDHKLKKLNTISGKLKWEYEYDDVIKGTGTIWVNQSASDINNSIVILQGSRLGVGNYLDSKHIPSYRAISYFTGKELWRLDVSWTDSYSRDVDASALIINDTAYIGLENSLFTVFSPDHRLASIKDSMLQPKIYQQTKLYTPNDVLAHKHNVVTESSPALLDNRIYISSGSGHVYGYNLDQKKIDWEFYTGSDMDGSPVITSDSCIIITIEKQYIEGSGGVMKINPNKKENEQVIWFFPTEDTEYSGWKGGVIGSAAISDSYKNISFNNIAAFIGIDGFLYVTYHNKIEKDSIVPGPNLNYMYHKPTLISKEYIGPSISTPIIVNNKIIAASYDGLFLFEIINSNEIALLDKFSAPFEATPVVHEKKIYIASRNGNLYCFGN